MKRLWILPWFGVLLVGCAVGPAYHPQKPDMPGEYSTVEDTSPRGVEEEAVDTGWWNQLGDPILARLVQRAGSDNLTLRAATVRIAEARALRNAVAGQYVPRIDGTGGYSRSRLSGNGPGIAQLARTGLFDLENGGYEAVFDARWELDLFGRIQRSVEGAEARVEQTRFRRKDVRRSVFAEVGRTYVELRGTQRRLQILDRNIEIQKQTLDQVQKKFDLGLVSALDRQQARTQLRATRSRRPELRARVMASIHRLSVLVGRAPAELKPWLETSKGLPTLPGQVPVGMPSDLLRRRPDLREAERRLAAATADVGVATANLYPQFSLTGQAGRASQELSSLLSGESRLWALGLEVGGPIFRGGTLRSRVQATEARRKIARLEYHHVVLRAMEEVESAISRYRRDRQAARELQGAVNSAREAVRTARRQYELGLAEFLTVLDAERTMVNLEEQLAARRTRVYVDLIRLYKALGGGWEPDAIPSAGSRSLAGESDPAF